MRQEQLYSYQIESKSYFSHLFNAMHPLFSIFSFYSAKDSRVARFSTYFLQINVAALGCCLYFITARSQVDDNADKNYIVAKDIKDVAIMAIIASLIMSIPLRFNCLRAKQIASEKGSSSEINRFRSETSS